MSDENKTISEIREMAKLSLISNTINETQEKNLKMYPFAFFHGVKEAKIEYDFTNNQTIDTEEDIKNVEIYYKFNKIDTRHFCVSYSLTIEENPENTYMDRRFTALEVAIRNLFWTETRIKVTINGKLAYESKDVGRK